MKVEVNYVQKTQWKSVEFTQSKVTVYAQTRSQGNTKIYPASEMKAELKV